MELPVLPQPRDALLRRRQQERMCLLVDRTPARNLPEIVNGVGLPQRPTRLRRDKKVQVLHARCTAPDKRVVHGSALLEIRRSYYLADIVQRSRERHKPAWQGAQIFHTTPTAALGPQSCMANDHALKVLFGRASDLVQIIDADARTGTPSRQQFQGLHAGCICPQEGTRVRSDGQAGDMPEQVHSVSPARALP